MVKAGSLLYALFVCLVIAILTAGLLYVFSVNKLFFTRQELKNQLTSRCESCIEYYLSNISELENGDQKLLDLYEDGITCQFMLDRWGEYYKLSGKTFFKNDTVSSTYIVGINQDKRDLALYLCDFGEELKISGTTEIKGNMFLPKKRYKTVNIVGNQFQNNPKITGTVGVSSQNLPKIESNFVNYQKKKNSIDIVTNLKKKEQYIRSFDKPTAEFFLEGQTVIENMNIKGNYIVKSNDSITIGASSKLDDIIIKAPKVIIENDFVGTLQIYAEREIVIGSNVQLNYPSSMVINSSRQNEEKKINIGENSEMYGTIILNGLDFREKQNNFLKLASGSFVVGDIYCNGIMQLEGSVVGSVYAHKFQLETKSSKYADILLNAEINKEKVPEFYTSPLFIGRINNERDLTLGRIKKI